MKSFIPTLCVVAIAGIGVGAWGSSYVPYLSRFAEQRVSKADNGELPADRAQLRNERDRNRQHRSNDRSIRVKTVAAIKTALPMDVTATGWAQADETTAIAAQEQGVVIVIAATDGADVKQGDLVAKLDDRTARAAVDRDKAMIVRDEATLVEAEAALKRAKDLFAQNAGTQQADEQAKAARAAAAATVAIDKADLAADQVLLDNTRVRAPFDGRLGDIGVSPGAFLNAGAAIVTITRYHPIYLQFHLEERNLRRLKQALAVGPVAVTTVPQADGDKTHRGQISSYDNTVDTASGTILVKARFDNPSGALWPGQSVNLVIHIENPEPRIVVPTVAVNPGPEGSYTYVVKDGRVELTPVAVARAEGDLTVLARGLSDGDHVVVEGQAQLTDHQPVVEQFTDRTAASIMADTQP